MNKKDRAILYGLSIGDGHISYRTRFKNGKYRYEQAELIIGHGPKQKEYLEYKSQLLHSIFGGNRPKISQVKHTLSNGKTYIGYRISKTNPYFRQMHGVLYKKNKSKKVTQQVLNCLDENSLALWFCDDGSISHNKNKEKEITSVSLRICTQFSQEEAETVCNWLNNQYNISFKYFLAKDRYDIGGNTKETIKFINLIFHHIHNSMFYKIKPLAELTIRKSARHPSFEIDEDIVQSVKNKIDSVVE